VDRIGIHVEARGEGAVAALEQLVGEIAPALGVNWVIAQIDNAYQYVSHPEVAEPNAMTADGARRLAGMARENGIELVPMYNCLGHQSWRAKVGGLLRAHPEFNEAPDLDPSAEDFYCMSWCPNHPDVNPLVFDLFDELLDAFEPAAFHVGMDEVFILGHCPRCKTTPNAELFAKAANAYHEHLVGQRGVEMQMWGDRLLPLELGYGRWESSENDTEAAADLIPKDVVICDWHYELMEDYPSVPYLLDKGFRVWPCGWKEEAAVRQLIEVCRREAGPKMVGYLCTTWCRVSDVVAGLAGEEREFESDRVPDVVSCVRLGAALAQD